MDFSWKEHGYLWLMMRRVGLRETCTGLVPRGLDVQQGQVQARREEAEDRALNARKKQAPRARDISSRLIFKPGSTKHQVVGVDLVPKHRFGQNWQNAKRVRKSLSPGQSFA